MKIVGAVIDEEVDEISSLRTDIMTSLRNITAILRNM